MKNAFVLGVAILLAILGGWYAYMGFEEKPASRPEVKAARVNAEDSVVEAEAKALLERSRKAVKALKDMSYSVVQTNDFGGGPQTSRGKVAFTLSGEVKGMVPLTMYRVVSNDEAGKPRVEWAMNGKQIQKIDHAARKMFTKGVGDPQKVLPPEEVLGLYPGWLFQDLVGDSHDNLTYARIVGESLDGGVKCKVVKYVEKVKLNKVVIVKAGGPAEGEQKDAIKQVPVVKNHDQFAISSVTKSIGVDDGLPRKEHMTREYEGDDEDESSGMVLTKADFKNEMTEVKANVGLKEADFTLKAPEGYSSEAGTPANMGLHDPDAPLPALKLKVGDPAPAFSLKGPDGQETTMESLKGRVVLLDFWATWCVPCKEAMPAIQALHEKYADKPLSVIGVLSMDPAEAGAAKYMSNKKYTYKLLLKGDDLARAYGISGLPTMILIGKDGKIASLTVGFDPKEKNKLGEEIEALLAR